MFKFKTKFFIRIMTNHSTAIKNNLKEIKKYILINFKIEKIS